MCLYLIVLSIVQWECIGRENFMLDIDFWEDIGDI